MAFVQCITVGLLEFYKIQFSVMLWTIIVLSLNKEYFFLYFNVHLETFFLFLFSTVYTIILIIVIVMMLSNL